MDPLSPHQLKKQTEKKNVIKFGPPLTKLSGSAHVFNECGGILQNIKYQAYIHAPYEIFRALSIYVLRVGGGIFIVIKILIELSFIKWWRPWSDATLYGLIMF